MPKYLVREANGFPPQGNPDFVNTAKVVEADSPAHAVEIATGCTDLIEAKYGNDLDTKYSWFFKDSKETGGVNVFGPLA